MIVGPRALDVGRALWVLAVAWILAAAPSLADPHNDYMLHCQGCHGPDGAGSAGGAPAFPGQVGKFVSLPGGREYLMRVPGVTQSELDDAQTAAVLNWLLAEFDAADLPRDFVPFSAAEVARHRHSPLTEVSQTRAHLLGMTALGAGTARLAGY